MYTKTCEGCNKEFTAKAKNKRFCNQRCYINQYMRKHNYMSQYYMNRKIDIFIQLGKKCNCCGITMDKDNFLSFDLHHKNGRKENTLSLFILSSDFKIEDIILLCAHCHRKITTKENTYSLLLEKLNL